MIPNNFSRITDREFRERKSLITHFWGFIVVEAVTLFLILKILGVL